MIHPHDAYLLARLVCGHEVNGEPSALPEDLRAVADQLASVAVADGLEGQARREALAAARWPLWKAMTAARPGLADAVLQIDPEAPPPIDDAEPADDDEWGPIRLGTLPPVEPFPLDVLPDAARDLAVAAAESIACPVDFPAVAILAAASGLIGRSACLMVKPGYFESASLFAALVGSPSSGKSPALNAALSPLRELATSLHAEWKAAMDLWKKLPPEERDDPPELQRITTSDPTTEALGPILATNPRGLTITPDEMTKWVMSMDQYKGGKGGDRPFYLSAWSGAPVFIDRAKNMKAPIAVPHPFLTVIGGMTPDMLSTLPEGRGRDDGFLARLLFAYPDPVRRRYSEAGVPDAVAAAWKELALSLWNRRMRDLDGRPAPRVVKMSHEAARDWAGWVQAHYAEQEADDFPDSLEGPWGKLEAYAARLALILHLMDLAADPTHPAPDDPPEVSRRILADALTIVAYFKSHARRVHAAMGGKAGDGGEDVRAVLRWVLRNGRDTFSTRDIGRDFDRFQDDDARLADALERMADRNMIRPRPVPEGRTGRKPTPTFDVNPSLKTTPRFRQFRRNSD